MYPGNVDIFPEKLNKKQDGSVYVIEEALPIIAGRYEGLLAHDNITDGTIKLYTGSKLTGEEITNFIVSVPAETPWRRHIKIFADVDTVYVTYETLGDTVEADDVNVLQKAITSTQTEVDRYKFDNDTTVAGIRNRVSAVEASKAEKTYVDTQLLTKADKATTYTKTETDARIQMVVDAAPEALNTLREIADALNNDPNFAATITTQLATKVDKVQGQGLSDENYLSIEKTKLAGIEAGANKYTHPATHSPSIIAQDSNNRFVTDAERTAWNSKSNLALGETSTTAYRGDRGKLAYDHSLSVHAPTDAQKNSDITKAEIEAKLTGNITSHTHSQYVTQEQLGSAGYGNMNKSVYDTDNDGVVDAAESVPWLGITGKPSTFAPGTHTHIIANVTGLQTVLDGKLTKGSLTWNDLRGL